MAPSRKREPFDRRRSFVTVRKFSFGGRNYDFGEPFDKSSAIQRRLEQLYNHRYITMTNDPPATVVDNAPDPVEALPITALSTGELREWLKRRGVRVRHNAKRPKLLERAERVLREEQQVAKDAA